MLPQRIVGGNGSIQHYNTLHTTDNTILKNNNVVNAHCGGNNNWNKKSTWLFSQTPVIGNNSSLVTEWHGDRKHCICAPKMCYKSGHTTNDSAIITKTEKHTKNFLCETAADDGKDGEKTCCCQPSTNNNQLQSHQRIDNDMQRISNTEVELMHGRVTISPLPEDDDCDDCDDGDEEDDVDFRKSIIRINNIYNSCRDMNNGHANDSEKIVFMNNTHHQLCHNNSMTKMTNDINL